VWAAVTKFSTEWLINRYLFLTILEAGSLRSGCQHGQVGALFQVVDFFLYPHMVERISFLSGASTIRALISFMKAPSSGPSYLPNASYCNTLTSGISFQYVNRVGGLGAYKHAKYSME